jgi:hypothetical protein
MKRPFEVFEEVVNKASATVATAQSWKFSDISVEEKPEEQEVTLKSNGIIMHQSSIF